MDLTTRAASRRRFLMTAAALAGSAAIAACAPTAPSAPSKPAEPAKPAEASKPAEAAKPAESKPAAPAAAPAAAKPTEVTSPLAKPAAPAAPAAAAKPADAPAGLKDVPRNRTLKTALTGRDGKLFNPDIWSPYTVGSDTSNMNQIIFEPLAYFSVFANKEILWTAESYEYTPDFKQLTIKLRKDITWSDDKPFTAEDVAYTFTTLKSLGAKVRWGSDVAQYVDTATAADPQTVKLVFRAPAPRFFDFISYKYDIGVPIVPKHVFDGQDWASFKNFDLAKGWPLTTGPWKVMYAAPEQKIVDRRDTWWGVKAGIAEMPKVERIILICWVGEQQVVQSLINNELDFTYSLQPATFPAVFKANPKITTHSGTKLPYGYEDWWPIGLWIQNEQKPFDDKDMRWALSYMIDREKLVEVGWSGASAASPLPIPGYAPLQPYFDAVKPLLEKYNTNLYDPKKAEGILNSKGWKKNGQGVYADASGATLKLEVISSGTAGNALGPILLELLKREGVDATFSLPPDFGDRFAKGAYQAAINGHGGSVRDPYNTMRLYQTQTEVIPGLTTFTNLDHWKNAEFDKITDQVYQTDMKDIKKLTELWTKAMEIWLPELPDIQLTKFHHRIPMNTTYWTNYPTEENPYVNGALWALTFGYTLTMLKPVQ